MDHASEKGEVCTLVQKGNLKCIGHFEDLGVDRIIILK
jgi:hypothetical protein